MTARPVALTCGDPAGIGPEITQKAWSALRNKIPFFVIGDRSLYHDVPTQIIETPEGAAACCTSALPVLHDPLPKHATSGLPDTANAAAVVASIERAVAYAQQKRVCAVTTNPISKKVLIEGAGFGFPGHTEFLASLAGVDRSVMMLVAPELRVVPATIHIPLSEVPTALTADVLDQTLSIMDNALRTDFGLTDPRIAVAGLNPHAGEGGVMGSEDQTIIAPALARARAKHINVEGPLPADTMFHPPARARYDAALCMYHDQALIPLKTLNFSAGVNVTLGIDFVRTSPDHGTAFDIAGRGVADPLSLIEAIELAHEMGLERAKARP
ncbi:MAG: 4-hydroxythreonine-4-phosphate dehydrogenase PdxA [Pseudomonadota bacterium]